MLGALGGTRVLDAATNIAGPYAASILSDLGAEVIKIEPVNGDPMRAYPPFVDGVGTQYAAVNHDKRYLAVDLRGETGRALLATLVRQSDVLIQNVRAGRESALGLDAATCHHANPRLIHASVAAFYPIDGDRAGYDMLVQGESGLLDLTGEPDRPPSRIGASAIDHVSGLWTAIGILAALKTERDRLTVNVSMLDVAVALLNEKVSAFVGTGVVPERMGGGTPSTTPHGPFPTADAYIVIGAATDESYRRLIEALGAPVLGEERFRTQQGRLENRGELERAIADALAAHGAEYWYAVISQAGVPVGRVSTLADAVERHRTESPTGLRTTRGVEGLEVVAPPMSIGHERWDPLDPPGETGRDSSSVLADFGLSAAEIDELRATGVIR